MKNQENKAAASTEKVEAQPFVIPVEGTLGLLALGAVGIKAWRKVRDEAKQNKKTTNEK